ncbi:MAG: lipoprotein, partial [Acidimicrobiia bacterium]|nr:lipoprotein [Acidimicrobiia bacterium]
APTSSATNPVATVAPSTATSGAAIATATSAPLAAVAPRSTSVALVASTADGRARTYHLYVPSTITPASSTSHPVSLLVALHGGEGSGSQFEKTSGFDGLAEANGFIVVYPDGLGTGSAGAVNRTWNGGDCCGVAARLAVDDVAFIRTVIDATRTKYRVDPARIFVTGHSNGGIMAYRLACELPNEIAAIAVQSTSLELSSCHPASPVSLLHIHGTADQNIPLSGGNGTNANTVVNFNPPLAGIELIATADGCQPKPTTSADRSNPDLSIDRWAGCAAGTEVEFIKVSGAAHAWMGHPAPQPGAPVPYAKLDSSLTAWTFLTTHPKHAG